jgi:NDP-sugar pyrophosphorylase family protein
LRSVHPDLPKALVPVAGKPFLQWLLEWLRRGGIDDIHLAVGYKASAISSWLKSSGFAGASWSQEPEPLGTAGALKFAEPHLHGDTVLVTNGDSILPNLDPAELIRAHAPGAAGGTLAVTTTNNPERFGTVELDERNRVLAFREKSGQATGFINGGVYVLSRKVLDRIPAGQTQSLERDIFPAMAAGQLLSAHVSAPPLLDMGTPEGLATMSDFLGARS